MKSIKFIRNLFIGACIAGTLLVLLTGQPINAASGDLDPTFGNGGTLLAGHNEEARALAILPDGRLVAAGYVICSGLGGPHLPFIRLLKPDGSSDVWGSITGYICGGSTGEFTSVAIDANNKIVGAGYLDNGSVLIARFNGNGTLDTTFSRDGYVTFKFGPTTQYQTRSRANGLVLQPDGKIVVAGSHSLLYPSRYDFGVARLTHEGALDYSFSDDGRTTFSFNTDLIGSPNSPDSNEEARAVALTSDGRIVVAGYTYWDPEDVQRNFAVGVLRSNGLLDTSFHSNGKVITDLNGTQDVANAVAIQGDKILVAGSMDYGFDDPNDLAFVRYNLNGTLDTTFSGDGKLRLGLSIGDDNVRGIALQSDGKIIAAGTAYAGPQRFQDFAVVRLLSNGSLDTSFGGDGIVATGNFFTEDGSDQGDKSQICNAVTIQPDGQIVTAGLGVDYNTSIGRMAFARYQP